MSSWFSRPVQAVRSAARAIHPRRFCRILTCGFFGRLRISSPICKPAYFCMDYVMNGPDLRCRATADFHMGVGAKFTKGGVPD